MITAPADRNGFKVAVICALPLEAESVQSVFDICWEDEGRQYDKLSGDQNAYTTGAIGEHNVVLVHMSGMGATNAALAAASLRSSFTGIKLALVVGICGVVPIHVETGEEIVLGDIVISTEVTQYDFGRQYPGGFQKKNGIQDSLGRANPEIRSFMNMLKTSPSRQRWMRNLAKLVSSGEFQRSVRGSKYPGAARDKLFEPSYMHQHGPGVGCDQHHDGSEICPKHCDELGCEEDKLVFRKRHGFPKSEELGSLPPDVPFIHLGRVGSSAGTVMKSGLDRDRIAEAEKLIAFEMEGCGVWEQYPTVVIKAACDYADCHKNKEWQVYAAAMAAACLKVFLGEWTRSEQPADRVEPPTPIWHVPFDDMPEFVGRADTLQNLQDRFFEAQRPRIVSLLGLGGVGKSRLALELANQVKLKQTTCQIFWVQAAQQLTFEKDMLEIGQKLKIPGIEEEKADATALVKQRLSNASENEERWLLILDNADDEDLWARRSDPRREIFSLVEFLPKTANGFILITTRSRLVASFLAGREVVTLLAPSPSDATEMLLKKLDPMIPVPEPSILSTLLDKLACLPLAIVQCASFINVTQQPVHTYLELLDECEEEVVRLLSEEFPDQSRYTYSENSVARTWLISFHHLREHCPLAEHLLSFMACMHEKSIPLSLLPEAESKLDMVKAAGVLVGYSFVTKQTSKYGSTDAEEVYDMHRLVRLAARNWLDNEGTLQEWTQVCIAHMVDVFPRSSHKYKSVWMSYLPHARHLCESTGVEDLPERYQLLHKIGWCFIEQGKYTDAVKVQSTVLKWRERALGVADKRTLEAYHSLGEALLWLGQTPEAQIYLEQAYHARVDLLGPHDPSTLASMNKLATALSRQHKHAEAEEMARDALQARRSVGDGTTRARLAGLSDLALILDRQGKYAESEKMQRETLQLKITLLGKESRRTLISMNNLARVLTRQGKNSEAETLLREAVPTEERVLGKSHPVTLHGMNQLAICLRKQKKYSEAEALSQEALQLSEGVMGKDHLERLHNLSHHGKVLCKEGKFAEAEEAHREALQMKQSKLPENHPSILNSMYNLALALKGLNRDEEAATMMGDCKDLRALVLGADHRDTRYAADTHTKWLRELASGNPQSVQGSAGTSNASAAATL